MKYLIKTYKKKIVFILFFSSIYFSQNLNNEKLIYDIDFRFFSAGEATFETHFDILNNQEVVKIITNTKSNKFLDRFYKIRDNIEIWIDKNNYSLLKVNKKINEGSYKRNFSAIINKEKSLALFNDKKIEIPKNVFDPLAAIFYYRTLNLTKNNHFNFFTFDEGKINEVSLKVTDIESIKTPLGKFQCFVLKPFSNDGKQLFKNKGQMTIWISNDEKKLPVKIEQNTNIGKLILSLKKYTNNH